MPAIVIIGIRGDSSVTDLLTLSQVVLALQLAVCDVPAAALHQSRASAWAQWRNGWFLLVPGWGSAMLITAMDLYGLPQALTETWHIIVGR